ncbi:alpha/beta hydrolase [Chitinophaga pendula]|uniref:alpha/beta fold hydrolase n=1 Tax=Chitinophaga TaxID=79328 RepID=UPI000BAE6FCE|nr:MULTISPECIES: alpha/beta hydrolase [Chitinophaga]ASZ12635.1 alpha/beta hydrolase [Chitinophaga sp. MD30]UCJ09755.1 alpha/beta hydrolase [Chitinophaga pendula]
MPRILLMLSLLCTTIAHAQVNYGNNKAAGHYLNTRGIKLYYESYGQGEPLILMHINGGSIKLFEQQIPFFAKNYRVIAIDSRAHGKSIDTKDSLSFEMMADDLNALMDSLHLKNANIIGWSDGGITGLVMAMRYPERVKKLIVSGPNLWPDTTAIVPFVFHLMQQTVDSLRQAPPTAENKNTIKVVSLDLLHPHISLRQLHSIKVPTLVIGGDHDAIPTAHLVEIYNNIPNAYLWISPNTSHFVATSRKDEFNRKVTDFLHQPYHKIEGIKILE